MRPTLLRLVFIACVFAAHSVADAPLHRLMIASDADFEVLPANGYTGKAPLSIFPLSARMQTALRERVRPRVAAADYATGILIRTKNPNAAIQQVLAQIGQQSGRDLVAVHNSNTQKIQPTVIQLALDAHSVWCLLLTPRESDTFLLTCTYVIDER